MKILKIYIYSEENKDETTNYPEYILVTDSGVYQFDTYCLEWIDYLVSEYYLLLKDYSSFGGVDILLTKRSYCDAFILLTNGELISIETSGVDGEGNSYIDIQFNEVSSSDKEFMSFLSGLNDLPVLKQGEKYDWYKYNDLE